MPVINRKKKGDSESNSYNDEEEDHSKQTRSPISITLLVIFVLLGTIIYFVMRHPPLNNSDGPPPPPGVRVIDLSYLKMTLPPDEPKFDDINKNNDANAGNNNNNDNNDHNNEQEKKEEPIILFDDGDPTHHGPIGQKQWRPSGIETNEDIHLVISSGCHGAQNWESETLMSSWYRMGHPGQMTRLISGCANDQEKELAGKTGVPG
eukprot:UN07050